MGDKLSRGEGTLMWHEKTHLTQVTGVKRGFNLKSNEGAKGWGPGGPGKEGPGSCGLDPGREGGREGPSLS